MHYKDELTEEEVSSFAVDVSYMKETVRAGKRRILYSTLLDLHYTGSITSLEKIRKALSINTWNQVKVGITDLKEDMKTLWWWVLPQEDRDEEYAEE